MSDRWFIAHNIEAGKSGAADKWLAQLEDAATLADRNDRFTLGREDFFRAQTDMGKAVWKLWPDCRATEEVNGQTRYTGCVVPLSSIDAPIGNATYRIIIGFLMEGKPVYAWNPETGDYANIGAVEKIAAEGEKADFVNFGRIVVIEVW
jgi:hypothetical protein